jgi:hypothetical protein
MEMKKIYILTLSLISLSILACSKNIGIGYTQKITKDNLNCLLINNKAKKDKYLEDTFIISSEEKAYKNKKYMYDSFINTFNNEITYTQTSSWDDNDSLTAVFTSDEGLNYLKKEMSLLNQDTSICIETKNPRECFTSNIKKSEKVCLKMKE